MSWKTLESVDHNAEEKTPRFSTPSFPFLSIVQNGTRGVAKPRSLIKVP